MSLSGAEDVEAFWQLLAAGRDAITEVPIDRFDLDAYYDPDPDAPGKMYTRHGGFLNRIDHFDPHFFRISPREAVAIDPQQRLLLELTWEAIEHAGIAPAELAGIRPPCSSESAHTTMPGTASQGPNIDAYLGTGTDSIAPAGDHYLLGLQGPTGNRHGMQFVTGRVHQACQALRNGECELALAGGVNVILTPAATSFSRARCSPPTAGARRSTPRRTDSSAARGVAWWF